MQTACIVFVVVFDIDWIVAIYQLRRNTVMQWLINFGYFEIMQGRVACRVLFLRHFGLKSESKTECTGNLARTLPW